MRPGARQTAQDSASNGMATTHSPGQSFSRDLQDKNDIDHEAHSIRASTHSAADHAVSMHHNLPIRKKSGTGEQVMSGLNNQPSDEQSGYEGGSESKERKAQRKMPLQPRRKGQRGVKKHADYRKGRFDPKRSENIPSDESTSSDG